MSGIDNFLQKKDLTNYYINTFPSEQTKTTQIAQAPKATVNIHSVRDEFVKIKKENGVIRKFYNFLKNTTGLGLGSKKVEKEIDKFEKGEITQEALKKILKNIKLLKKMGHKQPAMLQRLQSQFLRLCLLTMH